MGKRLSIASSAVPFRKNFLDWARFAQGIGGVSILFLTTLKEMFLPPFNLRLIAEQVFYMGIKSAVLVAVTGIAIGAVMALQMSYGLKKFGGDLYVPKVVSLSLVRAMCPVFTGILVAARVGSGIAAEIGSMAVTQQVDAIRALGASPIKKLVVPRLLAAIIVLPLLTLMSMYLGIFAGMLISYVEIGITPEFYYQKVIETLVLSDLMSGVLKTVFFGIFIVMTASYWGLRTQGGTKGVGSTTTRVVVEAAIFIMLSDFLLTKLFFIIL